MPLGPPSSASRLPLLSPQIHSLRSSQLPASSPKSKGGRLGFGEASSMAAVGREEDVDLRLQVVLEDGGDAGTFRLVPRWEPRPPKPARAAVNLKAWEESYVSLPEGTVIPPAGKLLLLMFRGVELIASVDLAPSDREQDAIKVRESNCYFKVTIDPAGGLAIVRFYEIDEGSQIHWKSTGVYCLDLIANGDHSFSSVDQIFRFVVDFHGTESLTIAFPPLRVNFKKDFKNEARIGEGVEGTVYRCLSEFSPHYCAVKEIRPQNFFEPYTGKEPSEVVILSMLNHVNIVELLLAWSEQKNDGIFGTGSIFVSMKLYPRSLSNYLNESGGFILETRQSIFKQILTGIDFMAQRGVVHRDIKPGNIVLAENLTAKIADFGIAKIKQPPDYLGFTGGCYGTKPYSAPEIMNIYKQHDEKVDIFSAGMVFYELFVPHVRGRKEKLNKLSKSIRKRIPEFDQLGQEFDLDSVLDGTNVLTDWRGHLPLLKRMTSPKAKDRPSAAELLFLLQVKEFESEKESFGLLLS